MSVAEHVRAPKVARDADTRGEGICRTCLAAIWDEGVKIGRAADMADIACRICHHAESDHTRAHAVKKYGFDTRQACTQCACVEWVAPKEVESVDDVAAVDLIDDLDDARRTMSSVEFDDDLYARTRDFILDAVSENQRLNAVLAHRTAQLDRLTLAKRGS